MDMRRFNSISSLLLALSTASLSTTETQCFLQPKLLYRAPPAAHRPTIVRFPVKRHPDGMTMTTPPVTTDQSPPADIQPTPITSSSDPGPKNDKSTTSQDDTTANSTPTPTSNSTPSTPSSPPPPFLQVLWRFTRPHTLIGSALAIPALHLFAAPTLTSALSITTLISTIYAMIPSLLMNLYITGLNQITDVEIDIVNKPTLPLPSGDLSRPTAIAIVLVSLVLSLGIGGGLLLPGALYSTQGLAVTLWGSALLGTAYSLPPFRLKRFPFLAAFCIVVVRGTVINAGFFAHARAVALGSVGGALGKGVWGCLGEAKCLMSCLFFAVFGIVIALMKDVPDVKGDALFNIKSFTVRIGPRTVFHASRRLLAALFFGVGLTSAFRGLPFAAATVEQRLCRAVVACAAGLAGWSVRREARGVDPEEAGEVYGYYMHLWKLFYLSYLVLPFAR